MEFYTCLRLQEVLVLCYEDLQKDLAGSPPQALIARSCRGGLLSNLHVILRQVLEASHFVCCAGHIDIISDFLGCPRLELPETWKSLWNSQRSEARELVLQLCSREAMATMSEKFDESWTYQELRRAHAKREVNSFASVLAVGVSAQLINNGLYKHGAHDSHVRELCWRRLGRSPHHAASFRPALRVHLRPSNGGVAQPSA